MGNTTSSTNQTPKLHDSSTSSGTSNTVDNVEKAFSQFFLKLKNHTDHPYINFQTFVLIITSMFPLVPDILVECLYRGFGKNVNKFLSKTQFVAILTVLRINGDRSTSMEFLFKVYDVRQCGYVEYEYVYDILLLAYGDMKKSLVEKSLKEIFTNAGATDSRISMKKFKRFSGDLFILTDWIQIVLTSLTEPNRNINLSMLNYHRYNLNLYARQVKVPYYIVMNMKRRYEMICRGNNALTLKVLYEFVYNETTTNIVMLSPVMLIILYLTKKVRYGMVWNIFDYFEFCIVFSNFYNDNNIVIKSLVNMFYDHIYCNVANSIFNNETDHRKVKFNVMKILLIVSYPNKNIVEDELRFIQSNINLHDTPGNDIVKALYLYYTESYDYGKLPNMIQNKIQQLEDEIFQNQTSTIDSNDKSFYINLLKPSIELKGDIYFDVWSELMLTTCIFLGIRPRFVSLEKKLVQTIIERQNKSFQGTWMSLGPVGTAWCIIDKNWYLAWQANNLAVWTIPISNSTLLIQQTELLPSLINGSHYDLIPVHAFLGLHAWYLGGPVLQRKVILNSSHIVEIEIYPIILHVFLYGEENIFKMYTVSKMSSVKQLLIDLCNHKEVDISCGRLWIQSSQRILIIDIDITIDEAGLCNNQHLFFETPLFNGKWPSSEVEKQKAKQSENSEHNEQVNDVVFHNYNAGFHVGLVNLGKTCYINSSLQALFHTRPVRDYFLSLEYIKDFNKKMSNDRSGFGKQLSSEIGNLIILIWTKTNIKTIKPNALIHQLYQINSEFSLEKQEDVHEFLSLLIYHLSQDLNNANEYFRDREFNVDKSNSSDEILSMKSDFMNLSNESSFIQYLFMGQFKSTIHCPDKISCSYESNQFESFNTLQLPLGLTNYRVLKVFIMVINSSKVYELYMHIDENYTVNMVIEQLILENPSILTNNIIKTGTVFIAADITKSKVNALLRRKTKVIHITYDLMLFEVSDTLYSKTCNLPYRKCPVDEEPLKRSDYIRIVLNQRKVAMMNESMFDTLKIEAVGFPFVEIIQAKSTTPRKLYEIVSQRVAPYIYGTVVNAPDQLNGETNDMTNMPSDDIVFGRVPNKYGFLLRLTKGGIRDDFSSCPQCSWLKRCNGCSILNHMDNTSPILVEDGDTISIDWNFLLFENAYDINTAFATTPINNTKSIIYHPNQTIEDCLDKFIEIEGINGSSCSKCCKLSLQKSMTIYKFPPILTIQLERFYFDGLKHEKLNKLIIFPLIDFDVSKYLPCNYRNVDKDSHIYDLYCVVNHVGSLSSGHYYAFCKNMETNEWYNFNDDMLSKLKDEEVISPAAYLLFYIRHDIMKKSYAQIVDQRLHEISEVLKNTSEIVNLKKNEHEKNLQPHVVSPSEYLQHNKATKLMLSKKYGRPDQEDCIVV